MLKHKDWARRSSNRQPLGFTPDFGRAILGSVEESSYKP